MFFSFNIDEFVFNFVAAAEEEEVGGVLDYDDGRST